MKIYNFILLISIFCFLGSCDESNNLETDQTMPDSVAVDTNVSQPETPKPQGKLILFEGEEKLGYKDEAGNIILEAQYDMAMDFENGIAPVVDAEGWAYINTQGEVIARPLVFDNGPDYFEEGLARFVENDKIGFMDTKGKKVIAAQFDFAQPFRNSVAIACNGCTEEYADETGEHKIHMGGKWGLIDTTGNWVIPAEYDNARGFDDVERMGEMLVDDEWIAFNTKGERITE